MTFKREDPAYNGDAHDKIEGGGSVRVSAYSWKGTGEAWLTVDIYAGGVSNGTTFKAPAELMRKLGAHLIAAADASEGKATVLPLPDCTCPTGGSWHRDECPANTYTHPRVSP